MFYIYTLTVHVLVSAPTSVEHLRSSREDTPAHNSRPWLHDDGRAEVALLERVPVTSPPTAPALKRPAAGSGSRPQQPAPWRPTALARRRAGSPPLPHRFPVPRPSGGPVRSPVVTWVWRRGTCGATWWRELLEFLLLDAGNEILWLRPLRLLSAVRQSPPLPADRRLPTGIRP